MSDWMEVVATRYRNPVSLNEGNSVFRVEGFADSNRHLPAVVKYSSSEQSGKSAVEYSKRCYARGIAPRIYYVSEIHEGIELRMEVADTTLATAFPKTIDEKLDIADFLAKAGIVLTEEGISHSDIKPSNIFLRKGKILLGDYDSALSLKLYKQFLKETNLFLGTHGYIPPEQYYPNRFRLTPLNQIPITHDIFSTGVVLFYITSGIEPKDIVRYVQEWNNLMTTGQYTRLFKERLPPPRKCPPHFPELIDACLAINPRERPTFREMEQILRS
ncbi:MAG: protein kinase [Candidatus Woesearchaeota archaeon]|jgi:serine/threonine protein kinase